MSLADLREVLRKMRDGGQGIRTTLNSNLGPREEGEGAGSVGVPHALSLSLCFFLSFAFPRRGFAAHLAIRLFAEVAGAYMASRFVCA